MKDIKLQDGDWSVINGQLVTIEKNEKLQQQLLKIIITEKNFYLHKFYGSKVMNILGGPYTSLESEVKAEIREALDYFIQLQAQGILLDIYDLEEILYKIRYMYIKQLSGDPRGALVQIGALDGTHKNVDVNQVLA